MEFFELEENLLKLQSGLALKPHETIERPDDFLEAHIQIVLNAAKPSLALPYLERLELVVKILKNE